ncbi:Exportin/Importin, Cse1-like protein [Kalmanozyma brasiliensis GHG001]|uniref:Nuclear transport receptor RANBP7/RANBP8 n=1 Tax=Kalmanozyma brasiliensis (strain GHG001) TaxID=1365824 RepID=V5GNP5_KALBG|nr:Exportin/Importin, Cse1-like protein [Kalmanozyma brasiliensis GHG001]EST07572.1 Exportin/Importin, Cse1-like protein [Kalmanozyma brasiliensis GHG001]
MDALVQVFTHSLDPNPNSRKAAELELKKVEAQDGMLSSVFQIVAATQVDISVRQAAAVYFKNRVRRHWDATPVRGAPTAVVIPQGDRDAIKANILQTLVDAPTQIRVHVANALGTIARCDFPDQWPTLMDQIGQLLQSQEPQQVYGGLRALLEVVRAYRWNNGVKMMEQLAPVTLPLILQTGRNLLDSDNASSAQVGEILYVILKVYKTSMHAELTKHQQSHESIVPWGTFLLQVVQKEIDPSQLPSDDDAKEVAPWWKAKKWAFHSLNKLFSRYGNPSQLPSDMKNYKPFADNFVQTFAPEILKVYLRIADANSQGKMWISKKAFYFLCMFFTECVKPKATWALLKPHVLQLTQSFIFPRLCFSEEDDELWELDAVDFVRANLDPFEEIGSISGSAATFVQTVASKRTKTSFMPLLEFVTSVVNAYPAQRSAKEKDGAFHLCRAMDLTMVNHEKVSGMLDSFFAQHVIPEMKSEHKFLRYRACDLVKAFDLQGVQWSDNATLEAAFRGVMDCIGDAELPVRVVAAEAIGSLIDHDEVHAAMAPNAARLMQELLKLSDETDLDILSPTKSKVVANFGEELLPFSIQLTEQMAESYLRLVNENLESADRDPDGTMELNVDNHEDDKLFAAMGCLNTIFQIIASAESKPDILEKLESVVLPIVAFTLEKDCVELFDDCLELTDTLTYYQKKVSPGMWHIFTLIYKSFKGPGIDYLSEMLPTIDNCVSYGVEVVQASAEYKSMLVDIFLTAMTSDQLGMTDQVAACKLADVILLLLRGGVDEALARIVQAVLPHTVDEEKIKADVRKWSIIVVLDALVYNAGATLQVLEAANATTALFGAITSLLPKLTRVHEKKVASSAIIQLLALEPASLPPALQNNLAPFLVALATQLDGLPEAIKKRNELLEAFENDEDEEDEDETSFASSSAPNVDTSGFEDVDDDKDVVDEDNEYLEMFARERAKLRARANGEELEDDDEEDDFEEDDEEDELSYESPMDAVPVFEQFRALLSSYQTQRPEVWERITSQLTPDQMQLIQQASQGKDERVKTL